MSRDESRTGCPKGEVLLAFVRDELSPDDSESIRLHVSQCGVCQSRCRSESPGPRTKVPTPDTQAFPSAPNAASSTGIAVALPRIGQYHLERILGRGGMGVVYRAQHQSLRRPVALKLLSHRVGDDPRLAVRFEREMAIVGRLDHANIVRATDAGTADGFQYLAMELVVGENLSQTLRRVGRLGVADACEIVRQAAMGLQHAHEHGLIHRDLKPNNLMIDAAGVVKVLDLGLARFGPSDDEEPITASGVVLGTPDYMAPEMWEPARPVDIRADLYSLAVTLYTLLVGRAPYSGSEFDSPVRKMAAHVGRPAPRLAVVRPDAPTGLQAFLDRAMAKSPAERFATPDEFACALEPFARGADLAPLVAGFARDDGPTMSVPARSEADATAPAGRLRRRWLVGAAVAILAAAGIAAALRAPAPVADPPEPPLSRPTPGEWFELANQTPRKAVWPRGAADANSRIEYSAANREWLIHSVDRALVELATIDDVDFELECTIHQSPWLGGVGVYFGDQPVGNGHEATLIALNGFGLFFDKPRVDLHLARVKHDGATFRGRFDLGSTFVPRPTAGAHKLWILARRSGDHTVQWSGQSDPVPLHSLDPAERPRPTAGGLGLFAQNVTAQFRDVRLRILP